MKTDGWRRAGAGLEDGKGQDIKHKDLWQEIVLKMAPHLVFMRAGGHSYQLWMQEKLKKWLKHLKKPVDDETTMQYMSRIHSGQTAPQEGSECCLKNSGGI